MKTEETAGIAAVAGGIAEALVTTAFGLFVAVACGLGVQLLHQQNRNLHRRNGQFLFGVDRFLHQEAEFRSVARRGLGHSNVNADIQCHAHGGHHAGAADHLHDHDTAFAIRYYRQPPESQKPTRCAGSGQQGCVVIALNRDGRIYLAKNPVTEADLQDFLIKRFGAGEVNRTVFLKADQAVSYGRVVQIVNQCRNAGVERVGLMADKEKER